MAGDGIRKELAELAEAVRHLRDREVADEIRELRAEVEKLRAERCIHGPHGHCLHGHCNWGHCGCYVYHYSTIPATYPTTWTATTGLHTTTAGSVANAGLALSNGN